MAHYDNTMQSYSKIRNYQRFTTKMQPCGRHFRCFSLPLPSRCAPTRNDEEQKNVLLVRPGITDEASIVFRDENEILENAEDPEKAYVEEIMPVKLAYNLEYITKMSLFYNIKLIFKTIIAVLK